MLLSLEVRRFFFFFFYVGLDKFCKSKEKSISISLSPKARNSISLSSVYVWCGTRLVAFLSFPLFSLWIFLCCLLATSLQSDIFCFVPFFCALTFTTYHNWMNESKVKANDPRPTPKKNYLINATEFYLSGSNEFA